MDEMNPIREYNLDAWNLSCLRDIQQGLYDRQYDWSDRVAHTDWSAVDTEMPNEAVEEVMDDQERWVECSRRIPAGHKHVTFIFLLI